MKLPNITIEKVWENETKWMSLLSKFEFYYGVTLTFAEKIILGHWCNDLKFYIDDWRNKDSEELQFLCLSKLERKYKSIKN